MFNSCMITILKSHFSVNRKFPPGDKFLGRVGTVEDNPLPRRDLHRLARDRAGCDFVIPIMINSCARGCHFDRTFALPLLSSRPEARHPPSCHLDRRPAIPPLVISTGGPRSGPERRDLAANEPCLTLAPGPIGRSRESSRPRGPPRNGATSDSQPDVSTPPRRAAALRTEAARHDKRGSRFARHDKTRKGLSRPVSRARRISCPGGPGPPVRSGCIYRVRG
jgi:hypothetical protein